MRDWSRDTSLCYAGYLACRDAVADGLMKRTGAMTRTSGRALPRHPSLSAGLTTPFLRSRAAKPRPCGTMAGNRLTIVAARWPAEDFAAARRGFPAPAQTPARTFSRPAGFPTVRRSRSPRFPNTTLTRLALLRSWSPGETATRLVGLTVHDFIRASAERQEGIRLRCDRPG